MRIRGRDNDVVDDGVHTLEEPGRAWTKRASHAHDGKQALLATVARARVETPVDDVAEGPH